MKLPQFNTKGMKECHFYIQSVMILVAIACALQIPNDSSYVSWPLMIAVFLGTYQYGMCIVLMNKLKHTRWLERYFYGANGYFIFIVILLMFDVNFSEGFWKITVVGLPWVLAIFFIVITEDLLWIRNKTSDSVNKKALV